MKVRMIGGDGDQSVFGDQFYAVQVKPVWFSNEIEGEDAYLFLIETGPMAAKYIAIKSRIVASRAGHAKSFLNGVAFMFSCDPETGSAPSAIGKAVLEIIEP